MLYMYFAKSVNEKLIIFELCVLVVTGLPQTHLSASHKVIIEWALPFHLKLYPSSLPLNQSLLSIKSTQEKS